MTLLMMLWCRDCEEVFLHGGRVKAPADHPDREWTYTDLCVACKERRRDARREGQ